MYTTLQKQDIHFHMKLDENFNRFLVNKQTLTKLKVFFLS